MHAQKQTETQHVDQLGHAAHDWTIISGWVHVHVHACTVTCAQHVPIIVICYQGFFYMNIGPRVGIFPSPPLMAVSPPSFKNSRLHNIIRMHMIKQPVCMIFYSNPTILRACSIEAHTFVRFGMCLSINLPPLRKISRKNPGCNTLYMYPNRALFTYYRRSQNIRR